MAARLSVRLAACRPAVARTLLVEGRAATTLTDGLRLTNSITATSPTAALPVTAAAGIDVRQVSGTPADLRLAKSGPTTATAGATVRYTLTVTNQGPVTATATHLLDALPPGVDFVAATASQGLCQGGVACQLGDLPAGAAATVIVTGVVQSTLLTGTQIVNAAQVGSANRELTPADNRAAFTTTVQALALLTLTKRAAATNVLVGDLVQYQIVVANSGPSTARAVTVADLMPATIANALVSSSRGGCTGFPCSIGDLEPGATATIIVAGMAAASGPAYNQAAVTSATDLDPASMLAAGALVTVAPFADIALHKAAAPTAVAGSQVVYTLTVYNDGPSDAAYITVTDALPAQAAFAAADPGCSAAGGVVTCLAPVQGAGMTRTFVITATTAADLALGSSIENRAIVAAATLDPNAANNLDDADTSIIGQAELAISKVDLFDPVTAGGLVTYTIVVTNSGPSVARAVDVIDHWPPGMSLVAIAAADGGQCAEGICRLGTLAAGATRTITVTLRVASSVPPGTLANVAAVDSPDSRATVPVVITATTTVTTAAALRVTKAALNNPAVAGGQQSYQVVVTNDGPSDAQAVRITDTLPAVTTYAGGAAECTAVGQVVTCDLGALSAGANRNLLINVTVDPATPDGMAITNVVTATSPTAPAPVTASAATTVRQPQGGVVDLAVAKLATPHTTAGESITYTLVVTNNGPSSAQNVQLVDALPLSVTILALSASQGTCAAGMVCQLGDLAPGASATVQLTGVVSAYASSGTLLYNSVQAGSSNVDANPGNNTAGAATTVDNRALLTIDKEAAVATVAPGGALAYRIAVHNGGPSLARSVVMTDLLPAQLLNPLLSSSRGSCGATACSLGDLPPGDTVTILLMGTASPFATGSIENRAILTTTTPLDPNSTLADAVTVLVGDTADLALVKTAVPSVYAGQTITYVLSVYNTGPSAAAGVQIADQLPVSVTIVSLDPACAAAGGQVHCPAAPAVLAANGQLSFTLVAATDASLATGTVLENRATVTSQTPDPNPVNNSATAGTTIIGQADLHIHKSGEPSRVLAGENLTYTIVVTNAGPSNAATVRLVDILPAAVSQIGPVQTLRSLSPVPIICLNLVCELGAMPLGEVITLTLPVHVQPAVADGTLFTNTATVYSPSDPDPSNNAGAAAATAYRESALVIQKSAVPDPAVTGADLLYTIQVVNLGPSDADGVTVADLLPLGFTPSVIASSQGACTALPCTLGVLPPGATAAVSIRGKVSPTQGGALVNTASVTATTPLTDIVRSTTTITTPVTASADLQLILQSTPTALAGMTATVYANLANHGPSAAVGAVITLTLPPGATFNQARLPAGWTATPAPGAWLLATEQTLPPGAEIPLAMDVDLDPGIAPGSSLEFVGVVTSTTPDPTPFNNTATADTSVLAQADLAISKSGPDQLPAGGLVTYTVVVQNRGPSHAVLRDLKDSLPAGLTLVGAALQGAGGLTACAGAICQSTRPLPVGELVTMTVIAQVDAALAAGTLLTNTATVFADAATPDPLEANNQASHTGSVVALAQITIDKYDLVDPVYPDALLAYAIVVANQGPSTAAGLVVTDTLPPGVNYMGSTGACVEGAAGVLTCVIDPLRGGACDVPSHGSRRCGRAQRCGAAQYGHPYQHDTADAVRAGGRRGDARARSQWAAGRPGDRQDSGAAARTARQPADLYAGGDQQRPFARQQRTAARPAARRPAARAGGAVAGLLQRRHQLPAGHAQLSCRRRGCTHAARYGHGHHRGPRGSRHAGGAGAHQHGLCPVGAAGPPAGEQPRVGGGHRAARHTARRCPARKAGRSRPVHRRGPDHLYAAGVQCRPQCGRQCGHNGPAAHWCDLRSSAAPSQRRFARRARLVTGRHALRRPCLCDLGGAQRCPCARRPPDPQHGRCHDDDAGSRAAEQRRHRRVAGLWRRRPGGAEDRSADLCTGGREHHLRHHRYQPRTVGGAGCGCQGATAAERDADLADSCPRRVCQPDLPVRGDGGWRGDRHHRDGADGSRSSAGYGADQHGYGVYRYAGP